MRWSLEVHGKFLAGGIVRDELLVIFINLELGLRDLGMI